MAAAAGKRKIDNAGTGLHSPAMSSLRHLRILLLKGTCLAGMLSISRLEAAPGDLDTGFGNGGKVTTDFAGRTDSIRGLAIQSDGKIIAGGSSEAPGNSDFVIARYLSDGSPDGSFGT